MINLDPSIVDQDSIRKKKRKKLLLIMLAPIIILTLASLFFLRTSFFNFFFGVNFPSAIDGSALVPLASMQKFANIIEPYIAPYNLGTAYIKDGKWEDAEAELRESIDKTPPKDRICKVRVNLSYSIEKQADEKQDSKQYDNALVLYNRAEGILYEDNCASRNNKSQGEDKNADEARERISKKRNQTVSKMNGNDGGGDQDGDDSGDGQSGPDTSDDLEVSEDQIDFIENTMNGFGSASSNAYQYSGSHGITNHW